MWWNWFTRLMRGKVQSLALGLSFGLGTILIGQPCVGSGQCASCGICLTRLPIALLPLLGAIVATSIHRSQERLGNIRAISRLTDFFNSR